jgi:predicted site-specific integrase-resolvase
MNYMTSSEAAKMWDVSQRRVQDYCKLGKIKGAQLLGNRWVIPKNAVKPEEKVGRPKKKSEL